MTNALRSCLGPSIESQLRGKMMSSRGRRRLSGLVCRVSAEGEDDRFVRVADSVLEAVWACVRPVSAAGEDEEFAW